MKVTETDYWIKLESADCMGKYSISIQNDCSQIRINRDDGEVFVNTNLLELRTLRKCLDVVIDGKITVIEATTHDTLTMDECLEFFEWCELRRFVPSKKWIIEWKEKHKK